MNNNTSDEEEVVDEYQGQDFEVPQEREYIDLPVRSGGNFGAESGEDEGRRRGNIDYLSIQQQYNNGFVGVVQGELGHTRDDRDQINDENGDDDDDDLYHDLVEATGTTSSVFLHNQHQHHQHHPESLDQHSYLPGAVHPLYTTATATTTTATTTNATSAVSSGSSTIITTRGSVHVPCDDYYSSEDEDDVYDENGNNFSIARSPFLCSGTGLTRNESSRIRPQSQSKVQVAGRNSNSCYTELAVLELTDVVLFPGRTLPIRITNKKWIQYIGRQIDQLRHCSNNSDDGNNNNNNNDNDNSNKKRKNEPEDKNTANNKNNNNTSNIIRIGIMCRQSSSSNAASSSSTLTSSISTGGMWRRLLQQNQQNQQNQHERQRSNSYSSNASSNTTTSSTTTENITIESTTTTATFTTTNNSNTTNDNAEQVGVGTRTQQNVRPINVSASATSIGSSFSSTTSTAAAAAAAGGAAGATRVIVSNNTRGSIRRTLQTVQTMADANNDDGGSGGGGGGGGSVGSSTGSSNSGLRRQSWTRQGYGPLRMQRFSARLIEELGHDFVLDDDDDDDDDDESDASTTAANNNTRIESEPAAATTTAASGRAGLDLTSDDDDDDDNDDGDIDDNANNNDNGSDDYDDEDDDFDGDGDGQRQQKGDVALESHRGFAPTASNDTHASLLHRLDRQRERIQRRRRVRTSVGASYVGRIGTIATVMTTHGDSVDEQHQQQQHQHPRQRQQQASSSSSSSQVWRQNEYASELILTVLGTSRFRILVTPPSSSDVNNTNNGNNNNNNSNRNASVDGDVPMHWVEELRDEPPELSLSSASSCIIDSDGNNGIITGCGSWRSRMIAASVDNASTTATSVAGVVSSRTILSQHQQQQQQKRRLLLMNQRRLEMISSIPATLAFRSIWPYKLRDTIISIMDEIPSLSSLLQQIMKTNTGQNPQPSTSPPTSSSPYSSVLLQQLEPYNFGYWVASNLALEIEEKLDLLELNSTSDVLLYVYDKVRQHHEREYKLTIHCKCCAYPVAHASSMFTVASQSGRGGGGGGGGGGTTGNYVNEYGIVHQTITIRQLALASSKTAQSSTTNNSNNTSNRRYARSSTENFVTNTTSPTSAVVNNDIGRNNHIRHDHHNHRHRHPHFMYQPNQVEWLEECEIVTYHGYPQVRDSWFSGYSWLIMSCAFCSHHLGWKFQKEPFSATAPTPAPNPATSTQLRIYHNDTTTDIGHNVDLVGHCNDGDSDIDKCEDCRPDYFFGLSGANVSTFVRRCEPQQLQRKEHRESGTNNNANSGVNSSNNRRRKRRNASNISSTSARG